MSIVLALIIISLLFVINAAFVILVVGPLLLLQPARRSKEWYARFTAILEPSDAGLPQENVTIIATDGVQLRGWLVRQPKKLRKSKGTVIYLHGVGDCKTGGIALTKFLFQRGYTVFLYDSRHHGESGGSYCTYGFYEKHDVSTVIDYLKSRKDLSVGNVALFGTSMGAAVAIQAAAIDSRISAVIAEASFTNLRTIFVDYQRRIIKLPWHFLRNVAMTRSQKMANFKARLVAPIEDVRTLKTPILFTHGTEDSFIKPLYSKMLYEAANEPKKLLLINGATHNDVWDVGGTLYEHVLTDFLQEHLS